MHRSGTSALARGLNCLDIDLGNALLGSDAEAPTENPRGFFEDRWALELSDRVLSAIGMRWDSPSVIDPLLWRSPAIESLRLEAAIGLRERTDERSVWGFKNPRTARLLPFWQGVFDHVGVEDAYVLALRNPLSIALSLERRNGFSHAKSHLLWLLHVAESVIHTRGRSRTCVDYDDLLEDPQRVLDRVATNLALPTSEQTPGLLEAYQRDFISSELRHSIFETGDVDVDPRVAQLARRAWGVLERWAAGEIGASDPVLTREFNQIYRRVGELSPVLGYLEDLENQYALLGVESDRLSRETEALEKETFEQREQVATLRGERSGLLGQIEQYHEAAERWRQDQQQLQRGLDETRDYADTAVATLSQRESDLDEARQALEETRGELADLQRQHDEQARQRASEADAQRVALQAQESLIEDGRVKLRTLESQLEVEREALVALQDEDDARQQLLGETEQALQTERASSAALREEATQRDKTAERTLQRLEETQREATSLREGSATQEQSLRAVRGRLETAEADLERARLTIDEQRGSATRTATALAGVEQRLNEQESKRRLAEQRLHEQESKRRLAEQRLHEQAAAAAEHNRDRAARAHAWFHGRLADAAREASALAEMLEATRTWRYTRSTRRFSERVLWREPHDTLSVVRERADALAALATSQERSLPALVESAEALEEATRDLVADRPLRGWRWLVRGLYRAQLRHPHEGPYEQLLTRVLGITSFIESWRAGPIELDGAG
jgi:hypothetical protein